MDRVFVDTGAFVALADAGDQHHEQAVAIYQRLLADGVELYTTNHVVDETCTWLLRRRDLARPAALRYRELLRRVTVSATVDELPDARAAAGRMRLIYSTAEVEDAAWQLLSTYDTPGLTFTDCASFAAMRSLSISKAFAFDENFDVMGFERVHV